MTAQTDLRARLVEAILGPDADATLEDPRSQLELVARVRDADTEIRVLLQQSVNSARTAGQSWGRSGRRSASPARPCSSASARTATLLAR